MFIGRDKSMNIRNIIKKMVPNILIDECRFLILKRNLGKLSFTEKENFKDEIEFILHGKDPWCPIPYSLNCSVGAEQVQVKTDYENGYSYVVHACMGKEHRLYFPKDLSEYLIKELYCSLINEQDINSPHCYFDNTHFLENETLIDIGAAEGIITLNNLERIQHAYLFEGDSRWFIPLALTFADFKDKVTIINKYVSDIETDTSINLNNFLENHKEHNKLFIKMDIEGMEMQVLQSMVEVFKSRRNIKMSICAYHCPNDAEEITNLLKNFGFSTRFSKRYMYIGFNADYPTFRKGVIYAEKSEG